MSSQLKVCVAQMRSGIDPDANLAHIKSVVQTAALAGANYILTPEVSVVFAEHKSQLAANCAPFKDNAHVAFCAQLAREHKIYLHIGSMAIAMGDGKYANRSIVFDPDGGVLTFYDKIHLFDADLPGENAYRESATYRGGDHTKLCKIGSVELGLAVCYDVRFPALFADLALAGAQMLSVPAAFTVPTGEAHWEILLRARAIETGCYVLAAAQGGQHENGRNTYGHSMIVDPWGQIVAQTGNDMPGLIYAEIDPALVKHARERVPALANRRQYSLSVNHNMAQ